MKGKFTLGQLYALSCSLFAILIATKRPIDLNQQTRGLIVIGLNLGGALEKRGGAFEIPLCKASPGIKIMRLK